MSKGFSGIPGNLQGIMKQAQKMQADLQRAQEEAEKFTGEGSAGGGMVKVVANGKNQIVTINIEREVVNPSDIEMLQDLIVAACNEALNKVQTNTKDTIGRITGGMQMPGLF